MKSTGDPRCTRNSRARREERCPRRRRNTRIDARRGRGSSRRAAAQYPYLHQWRRSTTNSKSSRSTRTRRAICGSAPSAARAVSTANAFAPSIWRTVCAPTSCRLRRGCAGTALGGRPGAVGCAASTARGSTASVRRPGCPATRCFADLFRTPLEVCGPRRSEGSPI